MGPDDETRTRTRNVIGNSVTVIAIDGGQWTGKRIENGTGIEIGNGRGETGGDHQRAEEPIIDDPGVFHRVSSINSGDQGL